MRNSCRTLHTCETIAYYFITMLSISPVNVIHSSHQIFIKRLFHHQRYSNGILSAEHKHDSSQAVFHIPGVHLGPLFRGIPQCLCPPAIPACQVALGVLQGNLNIRPGGPRVTVKKRIWIPNVNKSLFTVNVSCIASHYSLYCWNQVPQI